MKPTTDRERRLSGSRRLSFAVAAGVAVLGSALAATIVIGDGAAREPLFAGNAPSGATYKVKLVENERKAACLRLHVSHESGASNGSEVCDAPLGRRHAAGGYNLNCETGDFFVFGRARATVAAVRLLGKGGASIEARLRHTSQADRVLLLVASANELPARLRFEDTEGRRVQGVRLSGPRRACRTVADEPPSSAFGSF